jgi:hypothetical protein
MKCKECTNGRYCVCQSGPFIPSDAWVSLMLVAFMFVFAWRFL